MANKIEDEFTVLIFKGFATAIMSAGVIGFAYSILLKRSFLKEVQNSIDYQFYNRYGELKSFKENGIASAHKEFPYETISKRIDNSYQKIEILDTWIGNLMKIEDDIEKAINKGVEVKILLLNPECEQAVQRSRDIGKTDDSYVKEYITSNLKSLSLLYNRLGKSEKLKVKLYNASPIFTSYTIDLVSFVGFFWRKSNAEKGTYLEIEESNLSRSFGSRVRIHFDDLWDLNSTEFDLNKYINE